MLRTALALARKGLKVFPCLPRQKEPATEHGCKDASADPEIIQAWWAERPDCNVAIATGTVSGIFVVDIDNIDAEFEVRRLEAAHGTLPPTVEALTARGRHVYFKMPQAPVRNSASRIAPDIDVRGDGGYVLAPPSVHPTGRVYAWSVDSAGVIAEAPEWLLTRISDRTNGNGEATPPAEWRTLVSAGVDEGARDSTCARLAGHLLRRFIDPHVVLDLMQCWKLRAVGRRFRRPTSPELSS